MRRALAVSALLLLLALRPAVADTPTAIELEDTNGKKHALPIAQDAKATVIFFIGVECPRTNRYVGRLLDLSENYSARGVAFFAVNSNALETPDAIKAHAKEKAFTFPVVLDREQRLADRLGVTLVPSAVVLDAKGDVRYRGLIDDNRAADLVHKRFVRDAIDAVLAGKDVETKETPQQGCQVQRATPKGQERGDVTWSSHIAAIVHNRCSSCHRPGQVAPFPLLTYEQTRRWAQDVQKFTESRVMPPWKPVNHGIFRDERTMPDEEIELVKKWVAAGAPLGDAAKAPATPEFAADGWALGEPDLVLTAEEYELPATGDDEYRCFVLHPNLGEDKWVTAVELHPGNKNVVHHILGYIDTSGMADELDKRDPGPGYRSRGTSPGFEPVGEMGGWAPGNMPHPLPDGVGRFLPKNGVVVLEVHYHKNGKVEKDKTSIGIHFAKKPITRPLDWIAMADLRMKIPAGADRKEVRMEHRIGRDIDVLAVMPHMHLLGREAVLEARFPDGKRTTLIHIADWDFNWQDLYYLKEPMRLPAGTRIIGTMYYDNTEANPNNPNSPPKEVRWGERTVDEMALFYLAFVDAPSAPAETPSPSPSNSPEPPKGKKIFH